MYIAVGDNKGGGGEPVELVLGLELGLAKTGKLVLGLGLGLRPKP